MGFENLPEGWKETKLGEVATFKNGKSSPHRTDTGNYSVFGSNGVIGYADTVNSDENTIIIGRVGSYCGSVYFSKDKCWTTDNAIICQAKQDNDPRFVYYLSLVSSFNNYRVGTGQPLLNQTILKSISIKRPPLPQQEKIASILGALDDKIELNNQMNQTLEAMAKALFKSWFVDFEPFRCENRKADDNCLSSVGSEPKAMGESPADGDFVDSELGMIPKGWRVDSFFNTIDIIGGGTPKTSIDEYWNGEIPWYSVVDAPSGSNVYVVDTEKSITDIALESSSAKLVGENITIISARGTVGKLALTAQPMAFNQSCYALKHQSGDYYCYFTASKVVDELRQNSHGSVFSTITRDTFKSVKVVVPNDDAVSNFEQEATALMARIKNNLYENRTLVALRDVLLPKLMSGEIAL